VSALPGGLTSAQARERLARFGPNEFRPRERRSALRAIGAKLASPLIAILLVASAVSALSGDVASFAIIVLMVLLGVAIDFVQEHRAGNATEALLARVQIRARVLRDGIEAQLPVVRLVPGDVVLLGAGSLVPVDGKLVEANGLHVNEAMFTGEPFPVARAAGERMLMGTSIASGAATMEIERTGRATEVAGITASLAAEAAPSSFDRGTRAFGMLIMRLTAFLVLFVVVVNAAFHRPLLDSLLFAVALAVGLTPELLPMIVTVTLARGAQRLAAQHVIVKRLTAIEGLGSMDVLCTDKTGTLTRARIRVERGMDAAGAQSQRPLELAFLNSRFATGIPNPLDEALLAVPGIDASAWRRVDEIPFDFERRRVSVLLEDGARRLWIVKGAPEPVLEAATRVESAGAARAWADGEREASLALLATLGEQGLRVLAVGYREAPPGEASRDERDLVLCGFVAFADPPKPDAGHAFAALAASGVEVKILTGDGESVTRHVCDALGIPVKGSLAGGEIERLDDPALAARVEATTLFCRVSPAQKNRVVAMLRARGHVVGFIGDGINDAPALHTADIGISVSNAVDVARAAADLILLRRDLGVVHRGVMEGRRTFVNVRKYILMGTSSNFGNMLSMAGASLFLPFLPLLPTQILLNNLLYDVSEIPIPLDNVDTPEIAGPQKWDVGLIRDFMWVLGPVSSAFDFLTFYVLLSLFDAGETLFRTGWFVESLATQVLVIFVIRTRGSALASRPSRVLAATSLGVVACAVALPFTPLAARLGFTPIPPGFLAMLAGLVVAYLLIAEGAKRLFYRRRTAALMPVKGGAPAPLTLEP